MFIQKQQIDFKITFMNLTFLLPGDACSGGVRVTVQMANMLLKRGHAVRIAYRRQPIFSRNRLLAFARSLKLTFCGIKETRWINEFTGVKEAFFKLNDLRFKNNEIVIAVGNDAIGELQVLPVNVIKVRYCHGLVEQGQEQIKQVWGGKTPTVTVSPKLATTLTEYCATPILGIVPNGVFSEEYFVENRNRNGIGFIFHGSPLKGSEIIADLVKALRNQFSGYPLHVFGTFPQPKVLSSCEYTRYPSVEKARNIYNQCKIWLITSRDEGFCLPILEAMACGCAVISSRHINSAGLIEDGVNGFIVPYGDISEYIRIMDRLLSDESLRGKIVNNGFNTVRRFTWESAASSMEQVLEYATRMEGIYATPSVCGSVGTNPDDNFNTVDRVSNLESSNYKWQARDSE
jgi:glycosyltransferase involved in cell wall biosynthesis